MIEKIENVYCDRCGKLIEKEPKNGFIKPNTNERYYAVLRFIPRNHKGDTVPDLCQGCSQELYDWYTRSGSYISQAKPEEPSTREKWYVIKVDTDHGERIGITQEEPENLDLLIAGPGMTQKWAELSAKHWSETGGVPLFDNDVDYDGSYPKIEE